MTATSMIGVAEPAHFGRQFVVGLVAALLAIVGSIVVFRDTAKSSPAAPKQQTSGQTGTLFGSNPGVRGEGGH
jgi:hypothetical protein